MKRSCCQATRSSRSMGRKSDVLQERKSSSWSGKYNFEFCFCLSFSNFQRRCILKWADYAAVQAQCGNLSGNELTRNSSGNTRSQSSQLAEPVCTDPGLGVK